MSSTHTHTPDCTVCACASVHVKVAYSAHKATGSLRSGAFVCLLATLTSIMSQLVLVQLSLSPPSLICNDAEHSAASGISVSVV